MSVKTVKQIWVIEVGYTVGMTFIVKSLEMLWWHLGFILNVWVTWWSSRKQCHVTVSGIPDSILSSGYCLCGNAICLYIFMVLQFPHPLDWWIGDCIFSKCKWECVWCPVMDWRLISHTRIGSGSDPYQKKVFTETDWMSKVLRYY